MSDYYLDLATEVDDVELRQLSSSIVMPGDIELTFQREPSFFKALECEGEWRQVVLMRERDENQLVGFGVRSIQSRYVAGSPVPVGYLSSLRLKPDHRGRGLVRRGYRYLHQLHQDARTPFYLATIARGNDIAERLLTAKLKDMPRYHPLGSYYTLAVPVRRYRKKLPCSELEVRPGERADSEKLVRFLNEEGAKKLFSDHHGTGSIFDKKKFHGLAVSDVLLGFRRGELVAVLAGWDQHDYRQVIVHRYNGTLARWRSLYGIYQKIRREHRLPEEGQAFRYRLGALCHIKNQDENYFRVLLEHQLRLSSRGPYHYFMLGMHETDALLRVARSYAAVEYETRLYVVNWADAPEILAHTAEPIYLELGCL